MARPRLTDQRRRELLPKIAAAFARTGYRRTTTAELAEVCRLQETQLYRVWPSKKAMFLAAIDYLYEMEIEQWEPVLAGADTGRAIADILATEGAKRGQSGLHRITFAAFSEADDPEVRAAVADMYRRFHTFIRDTLRRHHAAHAPDDACPLDPSLAAWALVGLGTMINIGREFDLFSPRAQRRLMNEAGLCLIGGSA